MKIVRFKTRAEKALGLQHFPWIPDDTLYVFEDVKPHTVFHSRNVPEPFEIAYFHSSGLLIRKDLVTPQEETSIAPPGTSYAVEARPGLLS